MNNFNKTKEFDTQIKKHLTALKKACIKYDIPFFFAAATENSSKETKYIKEIYSGMASNNDLTDDYFPEFIKVTLGMKADIKRPVEEFILEEEDADL